MTGNLGIDRIESTLLTLGKTALANKYTRDFEVYMCAIELTTYNGDTIDYFAFPVMPSSISKTEAEVTTIQHSLNGITVFNKDGFIPKELRIQGNFGRMMKVIFNDSNVMKFKAINYSIDKGFYSAQDLNTNDSKTKVIELPYGIKTGYGCTKILQSIIDKAKGYDVDGKNFRLLFYNSALGESYLVVPTKNPLELSQNEGQSNMIWNYTLNLTIIADLKYVNFNNNGVGYKKSLSTATKSDAVQKSINVVAGDLLKYTTATINNVNTLVDSTLRKVIKR